MSIITLSSREFNQDTSRAKKATQEGPVFITDRGRPAHVLLSIKDYQLLTHTLEAFFLATIAHIHL
ncbi:MAG TPA: type II toxin-antitoxin system Phd/YefM family antitoxin [Aquirhabdus sp.]